MKERLKYYTHRLNRFLNAPTSILIILVLMFGYFAIGNIQFERENHTLLQNSTTTINQLKEVLCQGTPDKNCNLYKAVAELKADNQRQDRYISCVLAILGKPNIAPSDVTFQCEKMSADTTIDQVAESSSSSSTNVVNQNFSATAPSTPTSNNENSTSSQQSNSQPTYTQCVSSKKGLFGSIKGLVTCL